MDPVQLDQSATHEQLDEPKEPYGQVHEAVNEASPSTLIPDISFKSANPDLECQSDDHLAEGPTEAAILPTDLTGSEPVSAGIEESRESDVPQGRSSPIWTVQSSSVLIYVLAKSITSSVDAKSTVPPRAAPRTSYAPASHPRASIARQPASTSTRMPTTKAPPVASGHEARGRIASKSAEQPTNVADPLSKPGIASSMSVRQRLMKTTDSSAAKSRSADGLPAKLSSGPSAAKVAGAVQANRMSMTRTPRSEPLRPSTTTRATTKIQSSTEASKNANTSAKTRMSLAPSARPARYLSGRASMAAPGVSGSVGRIQRVEPGLNKPLLDRPGKAKETHKEETYEELKVSLFTEIRHPQ